MAPWGLSTMSRDNIGKSHLALSDTFILPTYPASSGRRLYRAWKRWEPTTTRSLTEVYGNFKMWESEHTLCCPRTRRSYCSGPWNIALNYDPPHSRCWTKHLFNYLQGTPTTSGPWQEGAIKRLKKKRQYEQAREGRVYMPTGLPEKGICAVILL